MFPVKTYVSRRAELRAKTGGGLILLPGNQPSANNYPNNAYYFRQDSTFLYYFGLDRPSLAGVIDADTGEEVLFGDDFTVDDIIWTGPQPTLREEGARAGVADCRPLAALADYLAAAIRLGRRIHYLPPYRGETKLQLSALLGIAPALLHDYKSVDLMFAVAEMREVKSAEEVAQMEDAFHIGYAMHTTAMRMCRAGARSPVRSRASPSRWGSACRSRRSSRSTARRCTTSTRRGCSPTDGCCWSMPAART